MPYKTATRMQRKAAKIYVDKLGKSQENIAIGAVMKEAGYSDVTSINPSNLTESNGFKQALKDYGLTEELIKSSLTEDIKAKPGNRSQELKLGAEILKLKTNDTNINIGFSLSKLFESVETKPVDNIIEEQSSVRDVELDK